MKRLRCRRYDPVIIDRTIGFVLGPFEALYRSFLKRCTLTNNAVGTIWRVSWRTLSEPPQRWQGPDPRPLWVLVATPSAFGHDFVYRMCVAQPTLKLTWSYILLQTAVLYFLSNLYLKKGTGSVYNETKKFSNTSQIRIFLTKIHVEINTNFIRFFFCSKCNHYIIQY